MQSIDKVNIFCITYNQKQYVQETLKGFLSQKTNFHWKVYISDDASTDGTQEVLKKYAAEYPDKIFLILNKENKGVVRNYFETAKKVNAEFVCFCEGDDYWTDSLKLQKQVDFLENNPNFIGCAHRIKVKNEETVESDQEFPSVQKFNDKNIFYLNDILEENPIPSLSVMYRWRFNQEPIPTFPEDALPCDWFMHLLHAEKGPFKCLPEVMGTYRVWHGGVWSLLSDERQWAKKNALKLSNFFELIDKRYGSDHSELRRSYKTRYYKARLFYFSPSLFFIAKKSYYSLKKAKHFLVFNFLSNNSFKRVNECNYVQLQMEVFKRLVRKLKNVTSLPLISSSPTKKGKKEAITTNHCEKAKSSKRKILVIGVGNSPHTLRWLKNIDKELFRIYLYSVYEIPGGKDHLDDKEIVFVDKNLTMKEAIERIGPNIVHTLQTQLAAYQISELLESRKKDFLWMHSLWGSDLYFWGRFPDHREKLKKCLKHIDILLGEGKRDTPLALNLGFEGTIEESIPAFGGIDFSDDSVRRGNDFVEPSKRKVISVKGYENTVGRFFVAMRALELVKEKLKGYEIHVYLASEVSRYIAKLFEYEHGIPVKIIEQVPQREMYEVFLSSRINLCVSLSDGLPSSFIEGMQCGAFPIQTNTSLANEWIADGRTGFLVPPNDPQEIAKALEIALEDDQLVDLASVENYKTLRERMDQKLVQSVVKDVYLRAYQRLK